jgi:plastocyanin
MKTKLLFMFLIGGFAMNAQETHMMNWFRGVTASAASMTINTGDTVMWMLTDAMPHTVTTANGAAETFNSGTLSAGSTYSHRFTTAGSVPYICLFHGNMGGTITVQAVAGVKEVKANNFTFYPNPVTNIVTLNNTDIISNVAVYDVTGRQVFTANSNTATVKVYMDNYPAGTYVVKAATGNVVKTISVIKQ